MGGCGPFLFADRDDERRSRHAQGHRRVQGIHVAGGAVLEAINESPFIRDIVKPGKLVSSIYTEQDYSYASQRFCGPGYFMVGDAACFLDPLLSSGVHLATYSGLIAAAGIGSTLRGEVSEDEAAVFFEKCYRQAYLRFLVFLSAFYDVGRKKESYFWEAQRLTEQDVQTSDLKLGVPQSGNGHQGHVGRAKRRTPARSRRP